MKWSFVFVLYDDFEYVNFFLDSDGYGFLEYKSIEDGEVGNNLV